MTTAINHILTNSFTETVFKFVIFKSDISDHFPICFMIPSSMKQTNNTRNTVIFTVVFDTKSIGFFKQKLYERSCDDIEASRNPDDVCTSFLNRFSDLSNTYFPKKQIKLKCNNLQSPLIANGIKKSSKQKQRLYEKFLKNGMKKMSLNTKLTRNFKNESIKKWSKKLHFSNLILKYKHNIKKTLEVIKESIGKGKCNHQIFSEKVS